MSLISEKLNAINKILIPDSRSIHNIGLLNGKMGLSIYFFHLARKTEDGMYQDLAENFIDEVYQGVGSGHTQSDFENGLAGIAWGIEYLVKQGFVEADIDAILSDVDDRIYRHIVSAKDLPVGLLKGVMGYMLYILSRLEEKDIHTDNSDIYIFKRLLIDLVNLVGDHAENKRLATEEPLTFDLSWDLPVCLILLARVKALNIYNAKIDRILDYLSPLVISLYPHLLCNRLYLILGMEHVLQQVDNAFWRRHVDFLKQDMQLTNILNEELKNKNLHLLDGIAGISLISRELFRLIREERFLFKRNDLIERITKSEYWEDLKQDELKRKNMGLLFGLAGVGTELLELSRNEPEILRK